MKFKFSKEKFILIFILLLAAALRFYNINWDQGYHLHPDERAIVLSVIKLQFPTSISTFLSPDSSWNPHFFAYGSLPMYLLRFAGDFVGKFNPLFAEYDSINIVGRFISSIADLITIIVLYKLAEKLFDKKIGIMASFFYAISALPIQLSHFYAVDTLLNLFILTTLYTLLWFYEKPTIKKSLLVGLFLGLALATKISALALTASIGAALIADFLLIFLKSPHNPKHWLPHIPNFLKNLIRYAFVISISAMCVFIFFEPFALIDSKSFWEQTLQQAVLTKNPFYFPYTLQYVGKIPYVYELKNIFLWGMGSLIGALSFIGFLYFISQILRQKTKHFAKEIIVLAFFLSYFLVTGKFAVGFMRYMLPLYPLFCLFAGVLFLRIIQSIKSNWLKIAIGYLLLTISLVWPISFVNIYSRNNTRVDATAWINQNIPSGKTLAIEHWDDGLPLIGQQNYHMLTLPLYDPDSVQKWTQINSQLKQTDFIIIASNRLYTPIQKLTDCKNLPSFRCYPITSEYYKGLFEGNLGFKKVAEFSNPPTIPIINIRINDQSADENFTVFDHPKIMIFQKTSSHSTM